MFNRLFYILLIILITPLIAKSQVTFVKGYMINDKGDTLKGEVKFNPKKEYDCYNKVFFKEDVSGIQKSYKPKKVKGYGFNGQHYVSMEFEGEPKFYRVYASGNINMYRMMYEVILMNKPALGGGFFICKSDEKNLTQVKEAKFKKQLSEWMKDNTEFINTYEDEKTFNIERATEVINQYNTWKAGH